MGSLLDRVLRDADAPALLEVLGERLPQSDLTSLLLEVAQRRAARAPSEVLRQYREDRFVRPGRVDPRVRCAIERVAFASVPARYQAIEIAPLAPLGTSSAVATASQHKIVSTMRGSDVVSDASNVLALECAVRRRASPRGPEVALCASARMTRAQALVRKEHTAHFQLFVMVVAGRDPGGRALQATALREAIDTQLAMLSALRGEGFRIGRVRVSISARAPYREAAASAAAALAQAWPEVAIALDPARAEASAYYGGLCFGVFLEHGADWIPLGDGGVTDWVAKLTGSRKERFFVGAIGTEALATLFAPRLAAQ